VEEASRLFSENLQRRDAAATTASLRNAERCLKNLPRQIAAIPGKFLEEDMVSLASPTGS
jgi:hypothetical protein